MTLTLSDLALNGLHYDCGKMLAEIWEMSDEEQIRQALAHIILEFRFCNAVTEFAYCYEYCSPKEFHRLHPYDEQYVLFLKGRDLELGKRLELFYDKESCLYYVFLGTPTKVGADRILFACALGAELWEEAVEAFDDIAQELSPKDDGSLEAIYKEFLQQRKKLQTVPPVCLSSGNFAVKN